jgi:hypothetical protein
MCAAQNVSPITTAAESYINEEINHDNIYGHLK